MRKIKCRIRFTVFKSVGELSSIVSVNCLQNRCRWTLLFPKKVIWSSRADKLPIENSQNRKSCMVGRCNCFYFYFFFTDKKTRVGGGGGLTQRRSGYWKRGYFLFYALQLGIYPKEWKRGYKNLIFKAGERFDPSNYRGAGRGGAGGHYYDLFRQTF